tara:strand:+ start:561 stop:1370 length:810 start_codon:yes stop_codon:yes gene_type:complete
MKNPTYNYILSKIGTFRPDIGIILGSGLGYFADHNIQNQIKIPYNEIPEFPESTVPGHAGNLIFGTVGDRKILCMQGRLHLYEGYSAYEVTLPIRIARHLGISTLFITNAAGGIRYGMAPGDLMFIEDHINFLGDNPLIGQNNSSGSDRFPDMTAIYDRDLIRLGQKIGYEYDITTTTGIYLATKGPSFETPAEIRVFKVIGADAVGMSTVPEAIVGKQQGMRICGISCISNLAAGISPNPLSHEEVNETVKLVKKQFATLLKELILKL